ncbi:hypothetical protein [Tamilnaduibacter salinus]|uniref:hypothetical protein n=1 Tax=Tamilnaduibacter salinus TaxID=1484056 RepID=UPI001057FB8E|nr:hypothetical protein [Tamilnaduibacter salinus]
MSILSGIFIIIGLLTLLSAGILYAFALSKFKKAMKRSSDDRLFGLGMDNLTDLFGPSYGTREVQLYFLKKKFLLHPSPDVVSAGKFVYKCMLLACISMLALTVGMVINAISS